MAKFWVTLFIYLTFALFRSYGADVDQSPAEEAANFALEVYNRNSKVDFLFKLLSFDFKKIQVIVGTEYIIDAELELTNCKKGEQHKPKECSSGKTRNSLKRHQCHFVVVVFGEKKGLLQSVCKDQQ